MARKRKSLKQAFAPVTRVLMDEESLELDPFWIDIPGASRTACPIEEPHPQVKIRHGGAVTEAVLHLSKVRKGRDDVIRFSFIDGQKVLNSKDVKVASLLQGAKEYAENLAAKTVSASINYGPMAFEIGITPENLADVFTYKTLMADIEENSLTEAVLKSFGEAIEKKLGFILDFGENGGEERRTAFFNFLTMALFHDVYREENFGRAFYKRGSRPS